MATPTALPATFVASTVLPAADLNLLRGAFRVLQVVYAATSVQVTSATTTPVDTGLTATITPQYTTSKILVCVQQNGLLKLTSDTSMALNLFRTTTNIGQIGAQIGVTGTAATNGVGGAGIMVLDSPATIAATTYKTSFFSVNNTATVAVQHSSSLSTIVLLEISA